MANYRRRDLDLLICFVKWRSKAKENDSRKTESVTQSSGHLFGPCPTHHIVIQYEEFRSYCCCPERHQNSFTFPVLPRFGLVRLWFMHGTARALAVFGFDGSSRLAKVSFESFLFSGHIRPRQGTEIRNLGEFSPLDFFYFLQWIFIIFLQVFCAERKRPQNVEKIARFLGGENHPKSCHVSGCHGFFFFGSDVSVLFYHKRDGSDCVS